ncbi:MAG: tetratricopeptide repeat protein [Spirochaetales bacterium]|nr:MAG: tetratricopeptide repeat protein [Spirochaetales bacterium]
MRSVCIYLVFVTLGFSVFAQESDIYPQTPEAPALPPLSAQQTPASPVQAAPSVPKPDALLLYNQGRNLESTGRVSEANAKYQQSIVVCNAELVSDPTRMDAYTVKSWSLFRLGRYREVTTVGNAALRMKFDPRIVEVIGEAYFYLGDDASALKNLQRYIENVGEYADRVPTAYFYMAESYLRQKRFDHADIAYGMAVYREPNMARWWYRYGGTAEALGQYARAYDLYGRALRLSPGMQEALDAQARVKARL